MHDQWVRRRTSLGREDSLHRGIVVGTCTQAVHRFGRHHYQLFAKQGGGAMSEVFR
jgi:hypothetical protein